MFNIPRYLASHPKRLIKKIKEWAGKIEQQQQREDLSKKIAKQFEGYVWKTGESPNCRCVVIPPKSTYEPGDHVTVYDRYRFAIPVEGIVKMKSPHNDGIEVTLTSNNNPNWKIGSAVWVHETQLKKREVSQ